jgi:hypothetical protein
MPDASKKNSLKCKFCDKICHGGITRIKYHLAKVPKSGVAKCPNVPYEVLEELLNLLTKKSDEKQRKTREKEEDRAAVNLSHSEGDEQSDEEGKSILVLKKVRKKDASSGGPMDKYRKLTPEEVVAARKGKSSLAEKVQSKLSTEKREEKRDRACEYICQFFYEAGISHNTVTLPSFDLMLEAVGDFGRNLRGPTPNEMSGKFLQKKEEKGAGDIEVPQRVLGATWMHSYDRCLDRQER